MCVHVHLCACVCGGGYQRKAYRNQFSLSVVWILRNKLMFGIRCLYLLNHLIGSKIVLYLGISTL